ncbi:MAG: O-antigen ligase family protein [Hyphomicrobium sp.]|nr:O-antigen ligase family protein [Hyphomicrobium sp.]
MVFTDKIDPIRNPLASRSWGIVLGTLVMCCAAGATFSLRTLSAPLLATLIVAIVAVILRRRSWFGKLEANALTVSIAAFFALAVLSSLWAKQPLAAISESAYGTAIVIATCFFVHFFLTEDRTNSFHIAEGAWVGFCAGLLYMFFELQTDQSFKLWLYNFLELTPKDVSPPGNFEWGADGRLLAIAPRDLTKNLISLPILVWPCCLAMRATVPQKYFLPLALAMFLLMSLIVFTSNHETSMVALVLSAAGFLLVIRFHDFAFAFTKTVWILCCLFAVPGALLLYQLGMQDARLLPPSAQHRVIIWNYSAERILEQPIFGHGVRTMKSICEDNIEKKCVTKMRDPIIAHSHNAFLQTWY